MGKKNRYGDENDIAYNYAEYLNEAVNGYKRKTELSTVPERFKLNKEKSCVCFGIPKNEGYNDFIVGMSEGEDGNVLVVGGSGSGKSSGIIEPTTMTWNAAMCVTDIKGELSSHYCELYNKGIVKRRALIFDPTSADSPSYDPFYCIIHGDSIDLFDDMRQIVHAIFPIPAYTKEPYWRECVQEIFLGALLYYYNLGLSFNQTISAILTLGVAEICEAIRKSSDDAAKRYIGAFENLNPEMLATFDRELRNGLTVFSEPHIQNAFRGERDEARFFSWDCVDEFNVFLKIPENRIEQWSGLINLMYSQLMHYLELRPDKYSIEGTGNMPVLLIMDEFAKFGKLDYLKNAISTLRSKSVNICLVIQSIAQLDSIYGQNERRIIMDNCRFKAILNANDSETQKLLAELIGTHIVVEHNFSTNKENLDSIDSYSHKREYIVQPHELAYLNDVILLTPDGSCRIHKIKLYSKENNPFYDCLNVEKANVVCGNPYSGKIRVEILNEPKNRKW